MFIEIINIDLQRPKREFINIDYILTVREHPQGGCTIIVKDRKYYPHAQESYEEICKLINDKSRIR